MGTRCHAGCYLGFKEPEAITAHLVSLCFSVCVQMYQEGNYAEGSKKQTAPLEKSRRQRCSSSGCAGAASGLLPLPGWGVGGEVVVPAPVQSSVVPGMSPGAPLVLTSMYISHQALHVASYIPRDPGLSTPPSHCSELCCASWAKTKH